MRKGFVQTENFRRLKEAEKQVNKRGAREAGLVIVKGRYGIGKTELLARYASDNNCVYVRAKETWTKRALLDELADALGLDKRGRNQEVQQRIIIKLGTTGVTVIVDEADFLIRTTPSLLEVLRDITDSTQITCFLIGMEQFPMRVARYGHIASRVASIVEFLPLSLEDVTATVKAKAEIQIENEVLPEILRQSEGRMRFVLNAVSTIEDLAETNGWAKVKVEHIKGRALCPEFTGQPLGRRREVLA